MKTKIASFDEYTVFISRIFDESMLFEIAQNNSDSIGNL